MADRMLGWDEGQLEAALVALGRDIDFGETPALAARVQGRLVRRRVVRWRRRLTLALAAVLLLLLLALAAVAIADRMGVRGVSLAPVPAPVSAPVGTTLSLGTVTSLEEAERQVGFDVPVPSVLGAPDTVYVASVPAGGQVSLVYRPRADLPTSAVPDVGVLLTMFRGDIGDGTVFAKGLPPGVHVEELQVNGGRGYWIEGDPHLFFYMDRNRRMQHEDVRLAGNVLLWEQGVLTLRLELAGGKEAALRIATSLR